MKLALEKTLLSQQVPVDFFIFFFPVLCYELCNWCVSGFLKLPPHHQSLKCNTLMAGDSCRSILIWLEVYYALGMVNIRVYESRKKKSFFSPWRFFVCLCYLSDYAAFEEDCPGHCSCYFFLLCIWFEFQLETGNYLGTGEPFFVFCFILIFLILMIS